MAVTWAVTINAINDMGSERVMDVTIVGTGTYTTGGDSLTPAAMGLSVVDFPNFVIDPHGANTNGSAVPAYNISTSKMQLFWTKTAGQTLVEVDNATTVTGITFHGYVYGV